MVILRGLFTEESPCGDVPSLGCAGRFSKWPRLQIFDTLILLLLFMFFFLVYIAVYIYTPISDYVILIITNHYRHHHSFDQFVCLLLLLLLWLLLLSLSLPTCDTSDSPRVPFLSLRASCVGPCLRFCYQLRILEVILPDDVRNPLKFGPLAVGQGR